MSEWGTADPNANRIKQTYIKGFLDISGGNMIIEKSSSLQMMSSDYEGQAALIIKPDRLSVFASSTSYDISYTTFAALGTLGVSYENSTTELTGRTKFLASSTLTGNNTIIGNNSTLSDLTVYGDIYGRRNMFLTGDASFNGKLYVVNPALFGSDMSLNGKLSANNALFASDVSVNGNLDIGTGSSSVAINKDVSAGYALDVSGSTMIRNTMYAGKIDTDISSVQIYLYDSLRHVSGNLYINNNGSSMASTRIGGGSIFVAGSGITYIRSGATNAVRIGDNITAGGTVNLGTSASKILVFGDASFNANTKLGSGSSSVSINKDVSAGYALDVSGGTMIRNTLLVGSDVSLNANLFVNNDLSLNGNLYVLKRSLFTADVSMNGNLDIGSGSSSVAINKDVSAGFALDVSGATMIRNRLFVGSDVSLNANLFVNNDLSLNGNLFVGKRMVFTGDVSMNGNTQFGASVAINKDISSGYALDVSGATMIRNTFFVGSDVSLNANLFVNNDLSLNGNLYVLKRSVFTLDVSMNGNLDIGSGSSSVAINKDVSAGFALDVSGATMIRNTLFVGSDVSLNENLFVGSDVSLNANLFVNNDLSLNGNLYVLKRSLFTLDVSMAGNTKLGSGSRTVAINKDVSAGYALDVSGLTVLRNTLFVGSDVSLNANLFVNNDLSLNGNLFVLKRSVFALDVSMNSNLDIGSGSSSVAINKDISAGYALDVSGATILRNTLYVGSDVSLNANLYVNNDLSLNGNLFVGKRSVFALDVSMVNNLDIGSGSSSVAINKDISAGFALDVSGTTMIRNRFFVGSDVSLNANLFVNNDLSLNGNLFVGKRSVFALDVSMVNNLDIGSGSSSVAINKDISAGFALDVSGTTMIRNRFFVGSDVSLNANLFVNNDLSLNGNLFVGKRTLFTADVSMNGNLDIGSGSSSVSINKDISSGYALDVSGLTVFRNALFVGSDVSLNANLFVNNDLSLNGNLFVLKRSVFTLDVSMNGNLDIGSGSSSVSINKDISAGYALDVSGLTVLRNTLYVGSDVSLNANLYVNNDLSLNGNLYVLKRSLFTLDVSMNGNLDIGSGSSSVAINKDISAGFALDVSGATMIRNRLFVLSDVSLTTKLFVGSDVSLNANLSVGQDLSLNGNLYVVKRSVFTGDVSMNGNVKLGTSVSVNKDISSAFALDVNGPTKFRGDMDVAGTFTVNGAPVSGGGTTFNTIKESGNNVQVGINNGFVTIDKPQFYADPSLTIYYNFDTSYNTTIIQNMASSTGLYDGSMNGVTSGLIIIDPTNPKIGTASLRNTPGSGAKGVSIGPLNTQIPVSSTMSFSVWVRKPNKPVSPDWDRIFEFSDYTGLGSVAGQQNNTIALDISADGFVYPKITYGGPSNNSCFATLSSPSVSYNLGNGLWNHILWTINTNKSFIYINGSLTQTDTITNFPATTTRASGFIAYSYVLADVNYGNDFSGNIDDFRYYKDKALNYAEIYQLYNNNFYTLDICGGFLANGPSVIYEPSGSKASANRGTLTLLHGDASGSSSIMFKSINDPLEYGYIQYEENSAGSTGVHYGLMTIGIENDASGSPYTSQADRISLFPSGGNGFVGVNTKTPQTSLDVSGTVSIKRNLSLADLSSNPMIGGLTIGSNSGRLLLGNYYTGGVATRSAIQSSDFYPDPTVSIDHPTALVLNPLGGPVGVGMAIPGSFALDVSGILNTSADANINNLTVGRGSGNIITNVAIGYQALNLNTTGIQNVAIGYQSLRLCNTPGQYNTAVGFNTLGNLTTGTNSVAIGVNAGYSTVSITTSNNTFLGGNTGITGAYTSSTAVGYNAQITANNQIVLGTTSENIFVPGGSVSLNANGRSQLILKGDSNATENSFVLCNGRSGVLSTNIFGIVRENATTTSNIPFQINTSENIGIGYDNNGIPSTSGYKLFVNSGVQATQFNATSDYREKQNIIPLNEKYNVDVLNPVTYNLKSTGKQDVGFIAHEVQEFYPFLVTGEKDGPEKQSLNYNGFIGILTKEIKELKKKVAEQEAKALDQDQRIQALEKMVFDLINK